MLTENPAAASTAAATAMARSACCGAAERGSSSSLAVSCARVVTTASAGRPGGGRDVASHHSRTWAGGSDMLARMSWILARSTISAPPGPETVGNAVTAATIFTGIVIPLTSTCTVEPIAVFPELRNSCVAIPGMAEMPGAAGVSVSCPGSGPGGPTDENASPNPGAKARVCAPRPAASHDLTAGDPDGPATPWTACWRLASSCDDTAGVQLPSAVPGAAAAAPAAVAGAAMPVTVSVASLLEAAAGSV